MSFASQEGPKLQAQLEPDKLMYHVFGVVPESDRYTAVFDDFVDSIANTKILLDHILCSPALARKAAGLMYEETTAKVQRQAWIHHSASPEDQDSASKRADRPSDHRPISFVLKT